MDPIAIIERYYKKDSDIYNMLLIHSTEVLNKALEIIQRHPELDIDVEFVKEATMVHDIGIFLTNAPGIHCHGIMPYICHGYLGREILDELGYHRHGLVSERHTGTGISLEEIKEKNFPVPHRNMIPISLEEQLICFADCFYSKSHLGKEKTIDQIIKGYAKMGEHHVKRFDKWCDLFL